MNELPQTTWVSWQEFIKSEFGLIVDEPKLEKFKILFDELSAANQIHNLISYRTPEELLYRHFADSLACLKLLNDNSIRSDNIKVIDIGTGAGFPGLPCKIFRPSWNITFVESITKKCDFINNAVSKLGLTNTTVQNTRAEELARDPKHREQFDILLSRAVTKLSPNIEISVPFLKVGGLSIIYKTQNTATPAEISLAQNAMNQLKCSVKYSFTYILPGQENKYTLLAFVKGALTSPLYPRKMGIPEKKPL